MAGTFTTTRRVAFRETDAAGIAHFSAFFHYMEDAEHELWRSLGVSVLTQDETGDISWPRVSCNCQYTGSVRFEDVLDIEVSLERLGEKSLTLGYRFQHDKREVAHGSMTAVCCRMLPGRPPQSIAIPPNLREVIERCFPAA